MGVWGASGQVCTAATRILAHRDIRHELVDRIVAQSRAAFVEEMTQVKSVWMKVGT